jgi:hypothetical protein
MNLVLAVVFAPLAAQLEVAGALGVKVEVALPRVHPVEESRILTRRLHTLHQLLVVAHRRAEVVTSLHHPVFIPDMDRTNVADPDPYPNS